MEIVNCPSCNALYEKNKFRDVCPDCWKKEEEQFQIVYKFMRKRINNAATVEQIVEQTGVKEELIYKFVKRGRLHPAQFPNLGYPCDRCGRIIQKGRICDYCSQELRDDIETFQKEEQRRKEIMEREKKTYFYKN
jgi:flagellar operon protein (TIGR03826 family)